MKTAAVTVEEKDPKYLAGLEECLKEIKTIRKNMKTTDAEIRRLQASTRRKLDETWSIIQRVQATL